MPESAHDVAAMDSSAPAASARTSDRSLSVAGVRNVSKRFGGTLALDDVSFNLARGEVLALLGENGAGKSTCVKLLAGVYRPDVGDVLVEEAPVEHWSPLEAQRRGIGVMHQHPGLFADLSVSENIFIGHMPRRSFGVDYDRMRERARDLLAIVGLHCRPEDTLKRLRPSEQQLVEIARALSVDAKVLIMDEPTAALSQREVERLFAVVAELKARKVAMMFVSHRMEEIFRVADRIAVLRDGRLIGIQPAAELDRDSAVQMMIGRSLGAIYPQRQTTPGKEILAVEGLSCREAFTDVSFTVRTGEILGLGGLVGSGRTEIARVLFGIDQPSAGRIRLDGEEVSFADPAAAMAAGIVYVSEDRLGQSLVMEFSILANASLPVIGKTTLAGLVVRRREIAAVEPHLRRLRLKFRDFDQQVRTLSGGNQQKVVLSKWLATYPRVLILDEPTQGIDVQSKSEVHAIIAELAHQGMAILLISSELPELVGMCDGIVVLREGRLTARFGGDEVDPERVIRAATDADHAGPVESANQVTGSQSSTGDNRAGPMSGSQEMRSASLLRLIAQTREVGLACAIAAVVLPVILLNPRMISPENLTAIAMDAALLMIVALAQMLVLLTRNIDLSVASVIGLSAYGAARFMHLHPQSPVLAGVGVAAAIGLACGGFNGVVVTLGRIPAIVVTLGTLSVFRGLNSLWAGGKQISADQVPQAWLDLTSSRILGVPAVVLIAIATLIVVGMALRRLPYGRELYAVGSNPDGAALIGIPAKTLVLGAFMLAGLLAGFDGAMWASRYATIDARVAIGFELTVIASVVVGGVAIRGGAGSVLGVALGALTLLVIQNGLTLVRVDPLWLDGMYGLVILLAVGVDTFVGRRAEQLRMRR